MGAAMTSPQKNKAIKERLNKTLTVKAQSGCVESRNLLIESNQGLIHDIVKKYNCSGFEYNDLFNQGILGFIRAISKFDTTKGILINTYATRWVRTFIDEYALSNKRMVNINLTTLKKARKLNKMFNAYSYMGDDAAYTEIASKEACEVEHVKRMVRLYREDYSLSDEHHSLTSTQQDFSSALNLDSGVTKNLNKLSAEDKNIIFMIYAKEKSVAYVAEDLGMTGHFLNKKLDVIYKSLRGDI